MTDRGLVPIAPRIERALEETRSRWPEMRVDRSALEARVVACVGDPATESALEALALVDLAWSVALAAGDAGSIAMFERDVLGSIEGALARIDREPSFADTVRQELRVKLLVGDGSSPARIGAYAGRGPLKHWVIVAAIRLAYDLKRRRGDAEDPDDEIDAAIFDDAEGAYVRAESRAMLKQWMEEALRALDDKRRGVLHLYFVEDVASEAIARMYGVHRGTIARWIEEARESVRVHVRRRALATPGMGPEGVDSLLRAADGHLSLSLSLLRS
jgi:RNA polymerase sigma-70 factor (ECF subfamily)